MKSVRIPGAQPKSLSLSYHLTLINPDREPEDLLLVACAVLATTMSYDPHEPDWPLVVFHYDGGLPGQPVELDDIVDPRGKTIPHERVAAALMARHGRYLLIEMLVRGAIDHLDRRHSYWRQENGAKGYISFAIDVTPGGHLSIEPLGRASIHHIDDLARTTGGEGCAPFENTIPTMTRSEFIKTSPAELATRYQGLPWHELDGARPHLETACCMLLKAAGELVPGRSCTRVTFEFEGDSEATRVEIIDFEDHEGRTIRERPLLLVWQPGGGMNVGGYLADAVGRYLDLRAPEWRKAPGAGGYVNIAIAWADAGELQVTATGRTRIWARVDRDLPPS